MTCERSDDSIKCKDPGAKLDYKFDWSDWLVDTDTIDTFVLTVPAGLTEISSIKADNDTSVLFWVEGGTVNDIYDVVCQITTTAGRIDERTMSFRMINK